MPVTTKPASHIAKSWPEDEESVTSPESLLRSSCRDEHRQVKRMIASSFAEVIDQSSIFPSRNGFVLGAIEAYNHHHHLIVRPDDVWSSILTQLSFYINAHAEELRGKFVAHDGQKHLSVSQVATLMDADYGQLADDMAHAIQRNVVDPNLRTWFMPEFTTTTDNDKVVASVIMMGSMQKYFSYEFRLGCGLPSVRLLGEKLDWEEILERLEKLQSLGDEPCMWYTLLKPVVERFIRTFDSPNSAQTKDFWQKIAHYSGGGSGPTYLSGWITAFCFWDSKGELLYLPDQKSPPKSTVKNSGTPDLLLDNIRYHKLDTKKIPAGFVTVPVVVDDNGIKYQTRMVAGSVGLQLMSSGGPVEKILSPHQPRNKQDTATGYSNGSGSKGGANGNKKALISLDTVQAVSGWWIFQVKDEK